MASSPSGPFVQRPGVPPHLGEIGTRLHRVLARALAGMHRAAAVAPAFATLVAELDAIRQAVQPKLWVEDLAPRCREHPLAVRLSEDPYTSRALEKPRGFAGDAAMLDFVYDQLAPEDTSELGRALFDETTSSPNARSVRDRCGRLTRAIRHTTEQRADARIATIACGHLRELQALPPAELARIDRVYAIDHDPSALARIAHEQPHDRVQTVLGSVRGIVGRKLSLEKIDLIYAAGLFDYLSDDVSALLLERMLSFLNPGGRLLVGNFTPGNWGRSYMETFMDWSLTYRTPGKLRTLGRIAATKHDIAIERVSVDDLGNVAYLELVRS